MSPPRIFDTTGAWADVDVDVAGCSYDISPLSPVGRPPTPPNSSTCRVTLSWAGSGISYPALLDPLFGQTRTMVSARYYHTASYLVAGVRRGTRPRTF